MRPIIKPAKPDAAQLTREDTLCGSSRASSARVNGRYASPGDEASGFSRDVRRIALAKTRMYRGDSRARLHDTSTHRRIHSREFKPSPLSPSDAAEDRSTTSRQFVGSVVSTAKASRFIGRARDLSCRNNNLLKAITRGGSFATSVCHHRFLA